MKKIFSILTIGVMCLTLAGCGNISLDLKKISDNLDNLTSDKFDILSVSDNIEKLDPNFSNLFDVYDYDLESMDINKDNIEKMLFKVSVDNIPAYIIVKPVEGKKEEVKKEIGKYLNTFSNLKEKLEVEHEGYLIYLFSDNNTTILEKIKETKTPVFGILVDIDKDSINSLLGIKNDDLDEFLVKNSVITQANSYYILKPKKGKKKEIKETMDVYMKSLEEQWKTYLPSQYELVKNRVEEEYGDYLIYIISSNNDLVLKTIKNYKK